VVSEGLLDVCVRAPVCLFLMRRPRPLTTYEMTFE